MRSGALPLERIRGVQTGGCPHTAIREDTSINHEALDETAARRSPTSRSCSSNPAATTWRRRSAPSWSTSASTSIDVAGGDKVPRKGGPGVTRSDLLVINKIDLAPNVGADLGVMARDAAAIRGGKPVDLHQPEDRRRPGPGHRVDPARRAVRNPRVGRSPVGVIADPAAGARGSTDA